MPSPLSAAALAVLVEVPGQLGPADMAYQGNTGYQAYGQQQATPGYGQQDNTYGQGAAGYNTEYNAAAYGQQAAYGEQAAYGQQAAYGVQAAPAYGAPAAPAYGAQAAPAYGAQQSYGQSPQNSYGTGQAYQSYGATVPTTNYGYGGNQATTTMKMDPSTPLVPPGEGKWRSSLFSCCSDMYICFSVCCCHAVTTGQLYERSVQKNMMSRIPLISCLTITLIIFVLEASQNVTSYIFTSAHYQQDVFGGVETAGLFNPDYWKNMTMHTIGAGDMDRVATHHATMILGASELAGLMALFCMCAIVCSVRKSVRKCVLPPPPPPAHPSPRPHAFDARGRCESSMEREGKAGDAWPRNALRPPLLPAQA